MAKGDLKNYLLASFGADKDGNIPKKYYHLYDMQTGNYLHSGRNSKSLKELKEEFLSYISVDFEDEEEDLKHYSAISMEELASMWEFRIDTTAEKMDED
jgi:5-hydroxyisourate hydrolase-like protein (transthyretin family)